jgi:hypothetical protein
VPLRLCSCASCDSLAHQAWFRPTVHQMASASAAQRGAMVGRERGAACAFAAQGRQGPLGRAEPVLSWLRNVESAPEYPVKRSFRLRSALRACAGAPYTGNLSRVESSIAHLVGGG